MVRLHKPWYAQRAERYLRCSEGTSEIRVIVVHGGRIEHVWVRVCALTRVRELLEILGFRGNTLIFTCGGAPLTPFDRVSECVKVVLVGSPG